MIGTWEYKNHILKSVTVNSHTLAYFDMTSNDLYLVQCPVERDWHAKTQTITVCVNGSVISQETVGIYRTGSPKMRQNQIPFDWAKGQAREAAWQYIKRKIRMQSEVQAIAA